MLFRSDQGSSPECLLWIDNHLILAADSQIVSINVETGKPRWRVAAPEGSIFLLRDPSLLPRILHHPPYVVAGEGKLFVFLKDADKPPYKLVAYDLASGNQSWSLRTPGDILAWYQGVLLLYEATTTPKPEKSGKEVGVYHAVAAATGEKLWTRDHSREDYHGLWDDPCFAAGTIWLKSVGLDPRTGKEVQTLKSRLGPGHCARFITTDNYLIGKFTSFISIEKDKTFGNGFYKNGCSVGQVPANGLIYSFPIYCRCIAYVRGFVSFSQQPQPPAQEQDETSRLVKGPAYGMAPVTEAAAPSWSTYRGDNARSAFSPEALPADIEVLWSARVNAGKPTRYGKAISPPVVGGGLVLVAAPDALEVCALDAKSGAVAWRYYAGGRVETPPTFYRGLCLFGANDGWVYCLRATDGKLVWRFNAAMGEDRFMARNRLESPWPVPNVLVQDGTAFFTAGWHAKIPAGLVTYALDPFSGEVRWQDPINKRNAEEWYDSHVNDVMLSDGKSLFMGQLRFEPGAGKHVRTWHKGGEYTDQYLVIGKGRDTAAVFPFGFLYDRNDSPSLTSYDATYWT